ncbi:hypothetical protein TNCV_4684031 [Trichonephila clavipes]|nr:hypothetical protein TNCV_4684031 [Trichonephila clavipes]
MMTQQTASWENWHLERGFELLRTFGLVRWGLGGSGHVEGTGEKLSFASQAAKYPKLPSTIRAGYRNCRIRLYIPNPLRCFKCQRFGHSQTSCRGQLTCSRCASVGHASTDCSLESKSRKLIVPHLFQTYAQAAKSSTLNNSAQTDENITKIKCSPLKLLAPLSSKQRPNISTANITSSSAQTKLLPSISSKTSTTSDPQPPTPMSEAKENIKEQPCQAHGPRKNPKKTDLKNVKPTISLKKNTEKNISMKIAREEDSLYESTPVSKRSRRRKTSKTSDAMDTDADPSDTDYVTGLTSEDESLLEADFKQVADNPLKGPLSPSSPPK